MITLLRITVHRIHLWILYAAISLASAVGLVFLFFTIFQCSPVDYFWNQARTRERGTCINKNILINVAYFYSVGAAFTDFTIGILLVVLLWNLRMDRRTKFAMMGLLGIGCMFVTRVVP